MSFTTAITACLRRYATFSGRSRRSEYWWWTLFVSVVQLGVYLVALTAAVVGAGAPTAVEPSGAGSGVAAGVAGFVVSTLFILLALFSLAVFLPGLAVTVRRLHDVDRSGWWVLLALVPFGVIVLLVFEVQEGTPGPNRFGPSPKHLAHQATAHDAQAPQQGYGYPG